MCVMYVSGCERERKQRSFGTGLAVTTARQLLCKRKLGQFSKIYIDKYKTVFSLRERERERERRGKRNKFSRRKFVKIINKRAKLKFYNGFKLIYVKILKT